MEPLFGGVEAGGTKFGCAIGKRSGEILSYQEIPTTSPSETLKKVAEYFKANKSLVSVGVGSFGPIDIDSSSSTYGYITNTPKEGWRNTDIRGTLAHALNLPVEFETDVGCAGLGEYFFGVAKGINNILYLTVGTGIGGAVLSNGRIQHGAAHPEMGHIFIPHDLKEDPFPGICPFHGDCLEGLASGPAIEKRMGQKAEHVIDPARWDLEARYLALGISNLIAVLSPKIIILGGGIIKHGGLLDEVSALAQKMVNDYMVLPTITLASDKNAVRGAIRLASQG
jgi:fructokinase